MAGEAGHSGEVIHITRALSDFFRISLSSGADWIPLAQELKHLSGYLSIQKARYRDILNYVIDVPAALGESYVLKLRSSRWWKTPSTTASRTGAAAASSP